MENNKPKVAIHKFSSCDGCQLAFLDAGEDLLTLAGLVDIVHFIEAGHVDYKTKVDIAFVEGSVSTPEEAERIKLIRENSSYLISIGACATAGGLQGLRNFADAAEWIKNIYAKPEYIKSLATSTPISEHVKADFELWGCPVNAKQVFAVIRSLLSGIAPSVPRDSVCLECKRQNNVCVLVAKGMACMGPVTQTGCGALCPSVGRECYECFGPSDTPNCTSLGKRFASFGLEPKEIARRFWLINSNAPAFKKAGGDFDGGKKS